ncbi:unnamed protein product [Acanthoscelides obtectus]|uniref:Sushi domain-containing protein n=1 Tax=Acanthoscelides obtectus TaxID=200917 RepID=A0A9P0Q5Y7_ACAOB|nr:unnamed protein product [Acanthoscelides obtectus]CAK1659221.1 Locomotion-related protein Hikaru genki [Acanthoscelides obtectus]
MHEMKKEKDEQQSGWPENKEIIVAIILKPRNILLSWAIAPEERDWKYRLSIYYAKPQDSGTFTCATPRGITNSVTLHVAAIHCEPISVSGMHLSVRVEGTRLGHMAIFQCPIGFYVSGEANLTCQASGKYFSLRVFLLTVDTSLSKCWAEEMS